MAMSIWVAGADFEVVLNLDRGIWFCILNLFLVGAVPRKTLTSGKTKTKTKIVKILI
jgi:hypothetical protein